MYQYDEILQRQLRFFSIFGRYFREFPKYDRIYPGEQVFEQHTG